MRFFLSALFTHDAVEALHASRIVYKMTDDLNAGQACGRLAERVHGNLPALTEDRYCDRGEGGLAAEERGRSAERGRNAHAHG
jgi:hypothetical protein